MRNILFRGKTYNKKWVYGIPVIDENHVLIMGVPIMKDTLGEWTGNYDKNNTPIFEGDFVARVVDGEIDSGMVRFENGVFHYGIDTSLARKYKLLNTGDLLVIGDNT